MIEYKTIIGGDHRYLSELTEFKNGLPDGVINKVKTDVGGTYIAANCDKNYIIVCPYRDLVNSIYEDANNKYNIFKCYTGIYKSDFVKYCKNNKIKKIAVTYDSLESKLLKWLNNTTEEWYVVIDEYHTILSDMDYRENAINRLMSVLSKFKHLSLLSATPINATFEPKCIAKLPHYRVEWNNMEKVEVIRFKTSNIHYGLCKLINLFLTTGLFVGDVRVEQLFIFFNSVTGIKEILEELDLDPDLVKISCASKIDNKRKLGDTYQIESTTAPNKAINFFTKKGFQGCNLFTNNGLIIVVSDSTKESSVIDISTALEQISGRIRDNKEYHNIFRNKILHFYNTNSKLLSDDEFNDLMAIKDKEGQILIDGFKQLSADAQQIYSARLNLNNDVVSIINNKMVYNELKRNSFIYKQELKKQYKDGFTVAASYNSKKFTPIKQEYWNNLYKKVNKLISKNYKESLIEYLSNKDESDLKEHPEFEEYTRYLSTKEMSSLQYSKSKLTKAVENKKKLQAAFYTLHLSKGFISSKDLKFKLNKVFKSLGITLTPKASLIENSIYKVKKKIPRINGRSVTGYEIL